MGNPHAVVFCDDTAETAGLRALAERYGPLIEHHPLFPERTNVEFVHAKNRQSYTAVIWERGCGITQACGTGACATAVAACLTGRAEPGRFLTVQLLGGALGILVEPDYGQVRMRGPAIPVFHGEIDIQGLSQSAR
jgi:diaminopimelate epimerase